jgi:hypothetical protein
VSNARVHSKPPVLVERRLGIRIVFDGDVDESSSAVASTAMATARPSSLKRPSSEFSGTAEWMILNDCYGGFLGKLGFTRCAHFKYEERKRCALF